jgi:uncharacterized membrane protein
VTGWDRIYREVDDGASHGDHAEIPARRALLTGVFLSAACLAAGLLLVFLRHEPRPDEAPKVDQMLRDLGSLRGVSLVYWGLLALAFTPMLRVLVMVGVYARHREWFMLAVSLIVLSLLAISVAVGTG